MPSVFSEASIKINNFLSFCSILHSIVSTKGSIFEKFSFRFFAGLSFIDFEVFSWENTPRHTFAMSKNGSRYFGSKSATLTSTWSKYDLILADYDLRSGFTNKHFIFLYNLFWFLIYLCDGNRAKETDALEAPRYH